MDARVVGKQEMIDTAAVVRSLCARLDPVLVPLHDVPDVYDELVAMSKLLDGAVLRMTARYEESNAWKRNGARSPEDDIAAKTGSTKTAARRRAETSKRLPRQPKTEAAVRGGELSEQQASEVSAGAEVCPDDEDALLATARRRPMNELRKRSAESRAKGEDSEARARRLFKARCVRRFREIDGMEALLLKLPPERMAEIDAYLSRLIDREYADARDRGVLETYEAYVADVVYRLLTGQDAPVRPGATRPATPTDGCAAAGTDAPAAGDTPDEDDVAGGDDRAGGDDETGDGDAVAVVRWSRSGVGRRRRPATPTRCGRIARCWPSSTSGR